MDNWTVTPTLWGAGCGVPRSMKTAGLNDGISPLHELAREAEESARAAIQDWEKSNQIREMRFNSAKKKLQKLIDAEADGVEADESEIEKLQMIMDENAPSQKCEAVARQYWTSDATPECVGEMAARGPIMVFRDELMGLFM